MSKLTYVTGNYGKYLHVKDLFNKNKVDVEFLKHDFNEPDINDIEKVSKSKALEAYNILKSPCFVMDTGFYIEDYPNSPGYPGAFVKRSGISENIDKLLKDMKEVKNRKCKFIDCLTFYDGKEFYTFHGISEGKLSYEIKGLNHKNKLSNLWYVFIPNNHTKTLAEMTEEERRNRNDNHTSALELFLEWYKSKKHNFDNYMK